MWKSTQKTTTKTRTTIWTKKKQKVLDIFSSTSWLQKAEEEKEGEKIK